MAREEEKKYWAAKDRARREALDDELEQLRRDEDEAR